MTSQLTNWLISLVGSGGLLAIFLTMSGEGGGGAHSRG